VAEGFDDPQMQKVMDGSLGPTARTKKPREQPERAVQEAPPLGIVQVEVQEGQQDAEAGQPPSMAVHQ
jgi:hypothetical protein